MDETADSAHLGDMKACLLNAAGAIALTFTLAACASSVVPDISVPGPAPAPTPSPTPTPAPAPTVLAPSQYDNFMDAPRTQGTWEYAQFPFGSQAIYNTNDPATSFAISCVVAERRISLTRPIAANAPRQVEILTETTNRTITAQPAAGGAPALVATLDARDDLLDAMAVTKGHFAVRTAGAASIYIPAWVEVSRVIEDCR